MPQARYWALILAGGDGSRLRELTHEIEGRPMPKQFCRLLGTRSLLEATLERTAHVTAPRRTVVILNRDHLPHASGQVRGLPRGNVLVQPCNRDTGPGLCLALLDLADRDPDAVVAVLPSDHFVSDDAAFMRYVEHARERILHRPDKIFLLGIHPDEPDPELGYVTVGPLLWSRPASYEVHGFVEKPDTATAAGLAAAGALWNSFVMVFRVGRMLELIGRVVPHELMELGALRGCPNLLRRGYPGLEPWSFSRRVLARITGELVVVRVEDVCWSDWGTRASIERSLLKMGCSAPWLEAREEPAAIRAAAD